MSQQTNVHVITCMYSGEEEEGLLANAHSTGVRGEEKRGTHTRSPFNEKQCHLC